MKNEEKRGWQMAWAGVGLIVVSCLLTYVVFSPEMLGLSKILYHVILITLSVIELSMVYILIRKFFGKKK